MSKHELNKYVFSTSNVKPNKPIALASFQPKPKTGSVDIKLIGNVTGADVPAVDIVRIMAILAATLNESIGLPVSLKIGNANLGEAVAVDDFQAAAESLPTKVRLLVALTEAGCPAEMIKYAAEGGYDEFGSDRATPLADLINDLRAAKASEDLVRDVMAGKFDATEAESDAWAASEEGQDAFRQMSQQGDSKRLRREIKD